MGVEERKDREFRRRERDIAEAALRLFQREDWQAVTVEEIAEAAEVGKGTVYKHFASKEEIYALLALDYQRALVEELRRINPDRPVRDRLRAILRTLWEHHRKGGAYHRVVEYTSRSEFWGRLGGELAARRERLAEEEGGYYARLLEEGVEQGVFSGRPLHHLLFGASSAVGGAIQQVWAGCLEGRDPDEYFEALADFIYAGLAHQ